MIDEPLFSLRRILGAIRQWFYLVIINELDISGGLWYFIKYHDRPGVAERDGKY